MGIISPINLSKWLPGTTILSTEARAEFKNIYDLVNGNLDSANIKNGSITAIKLADNSISGSKVSSIPASKITGTFTAEQLPSNILTTAGGSLNGTIVFDVPATTPLLKNYDNEEITLYEGGTGDNKIKIIVGGSSVMRVVKGTTTLWKLESDGMEVPTKLQIPVVV